MHATSPTFPLLLQIPVLLYVVPHLSRQPRCLPPRLLSPQQHGHPRVAGLVGVHVDHEGDHADVAGYGEDVDGGGCLLSDVDLLVGDVVAYGEGLLLC